MEGRRKEGERRGKCRERGIEGPVKSVKPSARKVASPPLPVTEPTSSLPARGVARKFFFFLGGGINTDIPPIATPLLPAGIPDTGTSDCEIPVIDSQQPDSNQQATGAGRVQYPAARQTD